MQIDFENLHHQTLFFYTVDGERLYQYSLTLSRSTRPATMQNSKILALSAGGGTPTNS
jgi:hypothetical protein